LNRWRALSSALRRCRRRPETHQCRTEVRLRRIPIRLDESVRSQQTLNSRPLGADATTMDEPDDGEARLLRGVQVLVDDRDDIARAERVQVDRLFDRDAECVVFH